MLAKLPDFHQRLKWFQKYRKKNEQYLVIEEINEESDILLSLVPKQKLEKLLTALLDEKEFLSAGGIRSISKLHETPIFSKYRRQEFGLSYQPAEGNTSLFGGNSNWRGPVWMPMNYLLVLSLQTYGAYYTKDCYVEYACRFR
jgi:hypothetical protein